MSIFSARLTLAAGLALAGMVGFGSMSLASNVASPSQNIRPQATMFQPYLQSVSFADAQDGWVSAGERSSAGITGPSGFLFHTTNAGKSWRRTTVHWVAQQMEFISPTQGWAIVTSPANCNTGQCAFGLVGTTNAGRSWSLQLNGKRCWQMLSMDFITSQEGSVIESSSPCQRADQPIKTRIMSTSNGGASWTNAFQPAGRLTSLHFGTPLNGWATADGLTGGNSAHCRTTLFGKSDMSQAWTTQLKVAGYCDGYVDFVSGRDGWLLMTNIGSCAEAGCIDLRLERTTDGGSRWTAIQKRWSGGGCGFLQQPHFVNPSTGYVSVSSGAGGGCARGGIDITHDGGRHWTRKVPFGFDAADLSPINASNVWAVACPKGAGLCSNLVHTTDGGRTWTKRKIG